MKTLLEKAKEHKIKRHNHSKEVTDEEIELFCAWLRREITSTQVAKALYPENKDVKSSLGLIGSRALTVVKVAILRGKIKFV